MIGKLGVVNRKGGCRGGHGGANGRSGLQNEAKILIHEADRKFGPVVVLQGFCELSYMRGCDTIASAMACMPTPSNVFTTNFIVFPDPLGPR